MSAPLRMESYFNRRRRGAFNAALAGLLLSPFVLGAGPALEGVNKTLGLALFAFAFVLAAISGIALYRLGKHTPGEVVIDDEGVRLGGELVPRAEIRSAYFSPAAGRLPACVRLLGEGERMLGEIGVSSHEEADRVLAALGLGPQQRAARFWAVAPRGSVAGVASLLGVIGGLGLFAVSLPLNAVWLSVIAMADLDEARRLIGQYVEEYNTRRLHSALHYLTPADYLR